MPDVNDIIAYENGDMDEDQIINFFQELIDSGMAWTLQGHYGRMAMSLVEDDSKALAIVRWAICNLQERWPKLARCRLTEQLCRHV